MKNNSLIKKYAVFILGVLIFGVGISFSIKSTLGSNPLTVLVMGVDRYIPLSTGACNTLVGLVMIVFGYFLDKEDVTLATFICLFGCSYAIDLGNMLIPSCDGFLMKIIYSLFGLTLYTFGLSLQIESKAGLSNFDCFIFGMNKIFNKASYHQVRWVIDGVFLLSGFLLGGTVGLGTIELLVFAGLMIEFFGKYVKKALFNN